MNEEVDLLRRYADEGSQPAFAELVRRTVDLVYAAALRQTGGDAHLAEDVTQGVYLALARRAGTLKSHVALTGWLYKTTRFLAFKAVRAKVRWQRRETEANTMMKLDAAGNEPTWTELRPVIDEAMSALAETDRAAMLLRYFEARPLAEIGAALGVSENAARMRVERALEKLRGQLARRGITSTAQPLVSAPVGLAASLAGLSLTVVGSGLATHFGMEFILMKKAVASVVAAAVLLSAAGGVYLAREREALHRVETALALKTKELATLKAENRRLRAASGRVASAPAAGSASAPILADPWARLRAAGSFNAGGRMVPSSATKTIR